MLIPIQTACHPYVPYGQMAVRNNPSNVVTITTATTNTSLLPITINTTYKKVEGFSFERGMSFKLVSNGLQVMQQGIYKFSGWASIRHSQNNATVGVLFAIRRNGIIVGNTPSPVPAKIPNTGDVGLISGEGLVELQNDDIIEVYIGSDKTGVVTVENCTIIGLFISPY